MAPAVHARQPEEGKRVEHLGAEEIFHDARSRAAALRLGFQFEGIFRQHVIVGGRNRDTAWFAILDSEWPALRSAMERYLDWDEASGARPSLSTLTSTA